MSTHLSRRFLLLPLLFALFAVTAAASCSKDGERLTVYSGRTENLIGPLLEQFSEETGLGVDVRYADSAELALLISEEGDSTPADVFISQSPGAIGFLADEGLLAELGVEILELVEPELRGADGTWVGLSGRQRVLVYNTELVEPADLPSSVLDLTDPTYSGQVAVAPSNGSFQDFVTSMRAEIGDDETGAWLDAMADNDSPGYANNTAIVEAAARGEVPMGLVNHYYNFRTLEENPQSPTANHQFASDDVGSLIIVSAAAVLEASDQPDDADALVQFLLSEESQTFFSEETFEYPLAAGVSPALDLPPLEGVSAGSVDFDDLAGGLEVTVVMIQESGLGS